MICKKCGEDKTQECFGKNNTNKSGRRRVCKSCRYFRQVMLKYNINEDFLNYLYSHDRCMCCRTKFKNTHNRHIHHMDTGVHGVLCCKCNRSLCQETDEDFNRIESAIIYMQSDRELICRISELPKRNQHPMKPVTPCDKTQPGSKLCTSCKTYYTVDSFSDNKRYNIKVCMKCRRRGRLLRRSKPVKEAKKNTTHCACCNTELIKKFIHHVGDKAYGIICPQCNTNLSDESKEQLKRLLYCRDWINQGRLQND